MNYRLLFALLCMAPYIFIGGTVTYMELGWYAAMPFLLSIAILAAGMHDEYKTKGVAE